VRAVHRCFGEEALMPMRDGQGIVHIIWRAENRAFFGALACATSYTSDNHLSNDDHLLVKPTRAMPTCVRCIARLFQ
jgi:hypothetical protein